jgi:fatty-acyl-CoA synthase
MVVGGRTLVLRKKFSASQFFQDCALHGVTAVQYIGELCRYLLSTPAGKYDRAHQVRIAFGNGLRPEIWAEFQARFNIPEIGEFYGATESNGALFNLCKIPEARGAVGRMGTLVQRVTGFKLARFNVEREELVRGPDGRCVEAAFGEPGELLMPIIASDPSTAFAGYSDPKATEKKLVRDAFAPGDLYFSSGDLLSRDAQGYYRFVDRIGGALSDGGGTDVGPQTRSAGRGRTVGWRLVPLARLTHRGTGSTTEVTEVVATFDGIEEANVYGVLIPNNQDGRAPCCAITLKSGVDKLDLAKFLAHARKNLPSYAVPLFLRECAGGV